MHSDLCCSLHPWQSYVALQNKPHPKHCPSHCCPQQCHFPRMLSMLSCSRAGICSPQEMLLQPLSRLPCSRDHPWCPSLPELETHHVKARTGGEAGPHASSPAAAWGRAATAVPQSSWQGGCCMEPCRTLLLGHTQLLQATSSG